MTIVVAAGQGGVVVQALVLKDFCNVRNRIPGNGAAVDLDFFLDDADG